MPKSSLPSVFSIVKEAWAFARKHPVLNAVLLWFFIVPLTFLQIAERFADPTDVFAENPIHLFLRENDPKGFLLFVVALLIILITIWGEAAILVVARRMLKSQAGRARTSFASVRSDALQFVIPMLFTELLRLCLIFYRALLFLVPFGLVLLSGICEPAAGAWGLAWLVSIPRRCPWILLLLPLFIPAVIYAIETSFRSIVVVGEDQRYRAALRQSKHAFSGRMIAALLHMVGVALLTLVPALLLEYAAYFFMEKLSPVFLMIADLFSTAASSIGGLFFLLSLTVLYVELRKPIVTTVRTKHAKARS